MANINDIINKACDKSANKVLSKLKRNDRIKYYKLNSFKRTEELLRLYPKLTDDNNIKTKINKALKKIENDYYYEIIIKKYFENSTLENISGKYGTQHQTMSYQRNRLVKILASELFPEEVAEEILEL